MGKEKWKKIRDFIVKNCKIVFPVLVVVIAAVTVVIALNANRANQEKQPTEEQTEEQEQSAESSASPSAKEVPLVANEDADLYTLVATYYNAIGTGEIDTLRSICQGISENTLLYYKELSAYIDHYNSIEIYSKQGAQDGTTILYVYYKMGIVDHGELPAYDTLYVCTDENGQRYIKAEDIFTAEEAEYIITASEQVDVVEFNNRVNVEYNELIMENPSLLEYVGLLKTQIITRVGEILSAQETAGTEESETEEGAAGTATEGTEMVNDTEAPTEPMPQYATAATTVNVRSSDSEKADKMGKVTGGTRVQVQEIRVNGWTKIVFDGKDGYIKSEYLQLEENAADLEAIGTVTATTAVNVRAAADEKSAKLGMLAGGSSLDLLAEENGWCKVNYSGQVGYVKADYVTKQ